VVAGWEPALVFENPIRVWAPRTLSGALDALAQVDEALSAGYAVAGALSYDFGALLHGTAKSEPAHPLVLLGVFSAPKSANLARNGARFRMTAPLCRVQREAYQRKVEYLRSRIRDGEVYQANYTVPFDVGFQGNPFDLYRFLARRANARYAAYVEHDDLALVSISPELFLRFEGDRLTTKPMKGTAPPARTGLLSNEKNRAEHLMIVDLLRNDLHRVCGDVRVSRLFEIERYPTFATMTSTITGTTHKSFAQIVRATFPCGSVTGAPKRAAMRHIGAVEPQPRGFYTGSIGYLLPRRRGWWNVCIRTLQFEGGVARFDAGGGIVSDSESASEWEEIFLKSRFLAPAHDGFALVETFGAQTAASDVELHVRRLQTSARAFGWNLDARALEQLRALDRRARIVRFRAAQTRSEILIESMPETNAPVRVCLARQRVRSGDPFLMHKTTWRAGHDAALREAGQRECFEALLLNERGEVTEGSRTTLFARFGELLCTPPLSSGVLPGILRRRLVSQGGAMERVLFPGDLSRADALYVGNSARGLLQAELVQDV